MDHVCSAEFVGRREEIARLADAFAAASGGAPGGVMIGGEAGIGKTRLVREFAARASGDGARVLVGGCAELGDGGLPYEPFVAAFRDLADEFPDIAVRDLLVPRNDAPAAPDPDRAADAGGLARARILEGVLTVVERLSEAAPLVLVLEDLHWADRATVDLLAFLLRNLKRVPALLVGTYRTDQPLGQPLRALLADLDRGRRGARIELSPFGHGEMVELLGGILGAAPAADLVTRVLRRSHGNPFFAEELLAAERDAAERDAADPALPRRLRDVLMMRMEALPAPARRVVQVAAAGGGRVPHRLVAAAAGLSSGDLLPALRDAVGHHVLVVDDDQQTYRFRHQLVREAVYADLLPGERAALHAAIARALERDPWLVPGPAVTVTAELAHHWFAADQPEPALRAAVAAGRAAADAHAYAEAQRQFDRAIELWDRVDRPEDAAGISYLDLTVHSGDAARLTGDVDLAVARVQRALLRVDAVADPAGAAMLWDRLGRYRWSRGETAPALAAFGQAVGLLGADADPALRARLLASQAAALMVVGRYRESRERCEEALELARTGRARAEEAFALTTLGVDLAMSDDLDAGIDHLRMACKVAEEAGTLDDIARAYANLSYVYEIGGRLPEAVAAARHGVEAARRYGVDRTLLGGVLLTNLASQTLQLGHWREAAEHLDHAVGHDDADGLLGAYGFLYRAELRTALGEWDAAAADVTRAAEIARGARLDEPAFVGPLYECRAHLALWRADYRDADASVRTGLSATANDEDPLPALRLHAVGLRATADEWERERVRRSSGVAALHASGAELLAGARKLAGRAGERGHPLPEVAAVAALCEAEFARLHGESDPQRWADTATGWDELHRPYPAAYARFRQAEALMQRRLPARAAAPLRAAWRTARDLAAEPLNRELVALARRSRIDLAEPERTRRSGDEKSTDRFRLTPRERQVLAHLVDGRTNRQIARALFIEEKTASVHVSNILAKLGAANRAEAAGIAHRLRLI